MLLVAHPGHELLLHGLICRTKPVVQILTDGSGPSSAPRLDASARLLRQAGARPGAIFGRLTDREAYAMILEGNVALVLALATELAAEIEKERPEIIVADGLEGYNPVHDLCRLIAGAAIEIAGSDAKQYEYAVVNASDSFETSDDAIHLTLNDAEHSAKIEAARMLASRIADVDELLLRHGAGMYRTETLRRVHDWREIRPEEPPRYEQFGEERVAAHRYARVIRLAEHMLPLRDALCAAVEKRSCAF
jgi:hypothetical protein